MNNLLNRFAVVTLVGGRKLYIEDRDTDFYIIQVRVRGIVLALRLN